MNYNEAKAKLEKYGQTQLLRFYDELSKEDKKDLIAQVESTDFSVLEKAASEEYNEPDVSPMKTLTLGEIAKEEEEDRKVGLKALKDGKVAMLLLAGGMGTRLGSENPKGMYNVGLTHELYIFECQMKTLLKRVNECGNYIHLFIMTSPKNDAKTRAFFKEKNFFGYKGEYVHFFIQDMAPIVGNDGKVLLEGKHTIACSPNGNGGWFTSLCNAGLYDIIEKEHIEYINVYAVDNVLQQIADPVFVGATMRRGCDCGAKVIRKANPDEKVGVICYDHGHPSITEYYELTDELRNAKDANGEYLYNFGVILNYLFKVTELVKIVGASFPLHKAFKKAAYVDEKGELVNPTEPNAYKYEMLVLDMIKLLNTCLSFEVDRQKEFAPIKNLHGVDSVDSARELLKLNGVEL